MQVRKVYLVDRSSLLLSQVMNQAQQEVSWLHMVSHVLICVMECDWGAGIILTWCDTLWDLLALIWQWCSMYCMAEFLRMRMRTNHITSNNPISMYVLLKKFQIGSTYDLWFSGKHVCLESCIMGFNSLQWWYFDERFGECQMWVSEMLEVRRKRRKGIKTKDPCSSRKGPWVKEYTLGHATKKKFF